MGQTRLPAGHEARAGTLSFYGGSFKGKSLVTWDVVADCSGTDCPAYRKCPYDKKDERRSRCVVQLKYMKYISNMIYKKYTDALSQLQLYGFGMHVMPLISHLIKLKLIEVGLGINGLIRAGKHGPVMHPVLREIRDTIKTIYAISREIGISPKTIDEITGKRVEDSFHDIEDHGEEYITELLNGTQPDNVNSPNSYSFVPPIKR